MKKMPALRMALACAALCVGGISASAQAAELKVLSTIALQTTLEDLAPKFGAANGHKISSDFAITGLLAKRLQDGEIADVFVGTRAAIDVLIKSGMVLAGSDVDLADSSVGIAVRKGAPRPDVSTAEALKRTLLAARRVACSDPATGAASGVHFSKVLEQLGIADQMKAKITHPSGGGFVARLLVSGEADLAVQQNAELMSVAGVELLGPLPKDLQSVTRFSAAILSSAHQPEVGKAFIRYLQTPQAAVTMKSKGLDALAK